MKLLIKTFPPSVVAATILFGCGTAKSDSDTVMLARVDTPSVIVPAPPLPGDPPVFTEAQATRGQKVYTATCIKCHTTEALSGAAFASQWQNRRVYDLFDLLSNTMPQNAPGSLTEQQYLDVVAYLLKQNGFIAGKITLTANTDSLKKMRIAIKPGQHS